MKLLITIEVDQDEEHCDAVLDELTTAAEEREVVTITTGGGISEVAIISVKEMPAVGRTPHDPHQLTIDDHLDGDEA
jgi:hypothetical protein